MTGLLDHTERLVRREIAEWPDGTATFTDYLDSDGIERRDVPITATVTIDGDEITADLTESAPMVAGALNSTRSFIEACVYQAVRCALTVEIPNTSGAFRPIHVLTKPGTIAEVVMPGASSMRGVTGFRVLDAVNGALAQLIPERVPAAGEGAVRTAGRAAGSALVERPRPPRRQRRGAAVDVLDHDPARRRLHPSDGGRRGLGRPRAARPDARRGRPRRRQGDGVDAIAFE